MKLKTHDIFNIGLLTLAGSFFAHPLFSLTTAFIVSFASNHLIDRLGHKRNRLSSVPVRTCLTHTPLRSLFWGFLPSVLLFVGIWYFRSSLGSLVSKLSGYPYWVLIQGLLTGPAHMMLDIPIEGGIFVRVKGAWKKLALGHFAYNNPLTNLSGVLMGFFLIYLSFTRGSYEKDFNSIFNYIRSFHIG